MPAPKPDLLEHGREPSRLSPREAAQAARAALLSAAALVLAVGVGTVVTRDEPVRPARVSAAAVAAPRSIPAERRALALPVAGHEPARVGAQPSELAAREATYAVAGDYCVDVSLVRLRLLRRDDDWSTAAYYVRVYEDRPRDGSFAIQLTWTGSGYDYFVTGAAGECRGPAR